MALRLRMNLRSVPCTRQLESATVPFLVVEKGVLCVELVAMLVSVAHQVFCVGVDRLKVIEVDLLTALELNLAEHFEVDQLELFEGDQ